MRIIAITRELGGDDRRQRVVEHLERRFEVVRIVPRLSRLEKLINLAMSFYPRKSTWREQAKKNAYFFEAMSRAIRRRVLDLGYRKDDIIITFEALFSPGIGSEILEPFVIYEDGTSRMTLRRWPEWVPKTSRTERYQRLESNCYCAAEHIFTTSEWVRQSLFDDYGIETAKVTNVGQGHDFAPPAELSACSGPILFVGYEFQRKGGEILLEAFKRVRATHASAELYIVGPQFHCDVPGVRVLGSISDKAKLQQVYLKAGIFALPSFFDPNPHAAMEAMSMGLPAIVSDGCGTREIIDEGVSGFVVPIGDVNALAERLLTLLRNDRLRSSIGREGANRVRHSCHWPDVGAQIAGILASLGRI